MKIIRFACQSAKQILISNEKKKRFDLSANLRLEIIVIIVR